jgi:hypothetical protein
VAGGSLKKRLRTLTAIRQRSRARNPFLVEETTGAMFGKIADRNSLLFTKTTKLRQLFTP